MGEDGEGREGWGGGEVEGHYGSCYSPASLGPTPWAQLVQQQVSL